MTQVPARALLILSDVDGTLLGDDGLLPASPRRLRERIAQVESAWRNPVTIGLASSRTLRELTVLQRATGIYGPLIAEDGALWATDSGPGAAYDAAQQAQETHGRRRLIVRHMADSSASLREHLADQSAFSRADTQQRHFAALQALGFRTPASARRALNARRNSVLIDPLAITPEELETLRQIGHDRGLQLRRGGRWFTLTSGSGKGPALCALRHHMGRNGVPPLVAAIGNEENDVSLLAEADLRFVIRNPHRGPHPVLAALPEAIVLDSEGPGGWMQMLDYLEQRATEAHS